MLRSLLRTAFVPILCSPLLLFVLTFLFFQHSILLLCFTSPRIYSFCFDVFLLSGTFSVPTTGTMVTIGGRRHPSRASLVLSMCFNPLYLKFLRRTSALVYDVPFGLYFGAIL